MAADQAFTGKIAMVTGGAAGIGRATAALLARQGATVAIVDINAAAAEAFAEELRSQGAQALAIAANAADEAQVEAAVARVAQEFCALHLAFNNIGGGETGKGITNTTRDKWDDILARNLTAPWLAMKYEIPLMAKSGGGSIVNTSSTAGIRPQLDASPAYAAAKAAVVHLSFYAARAHAGENIRVNVIAPGLTRTELVKQHLSDADVARIVADSHYMRRACEPDEVAATVAFLLSNQAAMITGVMVPVTGGMA